MSTLDRSFDPETLAIVRTAFDEACDQLSPNQQTQEMRLALADRILTRAAEGERNPVRLRTYALMAIASPVVAVREANRS